VFVAFDAPMLSLLLHQTARIPVIPKTTTPIPHARERIEHLVATLNKDNAVILIPAPALAEFLVVVEDAGPNYLTLIDKSANFQVSPMDEKAAVELAALFRTAKALGDKKAGAEGPYQKAKVDQQIVAIARSAGAERIYTSDQDIVNISARWKLACTPLWDLELPEDNTPPLIKAMEGP
jgi:predicted nucleic acid-binding protein